MSEPPGIILILLPSLPDFSPSTQILLEENYRSTGAILQAALVVVQEDKNRIDKTLTPTHAFGISPVLRQLPNAIDEADYIAGQIKHLIPHSGNLFDYGDFAILIRFQALSRNLETSLQKTGIPSRMVGGSKFFERKEVQDMLAYLQLVDSPAYTSAFNRVINTPRRGTGEKSVKEIIAVARKKKISPFEVCPRVANNSGMLTVTKNQRTALRQFVKTILALRKAAEAGCTVSKLVGHICVETHYEEYLERTYDSSDTKERLANVEELKAYAESVALENPEQPEIPTEEEEEDLEVKFCLKMIMMSAVSLRKKKERVILKRLLCQFLYSLQPLPTLFVRFWRFQCLQQIQKRSRLNRMRMLEKLRFLLLRFSTLQKYQVLL